MVLGRENVIARLRAPVVLPSLLLCDFGHLRQEVECLEAAGVQALHLDVMDGHFVPNLSYGLPIVEAVRRATELPLDVHLMIAEPHRYIDEFCRAGADILTIHVEAAADPRPVLDEIRSLGALAGLALNPPTALDAIEASLPNCDMVLVMSVMPGFGGQTFDPSALVKLERLASRTDWNGLLEVDGGVNSKTVSSCTQAGAELLVAGSAIFAADDYRAAVDELNELSIEGTQRRRDEATSR